MQISQISCVLNLMEAEARKRNAPVFRVASAKRTPFQALVFVMLSARTKDNTTLKAVEKLFKVAKTPEQIAKLKTSKLETLIYGVGFYRVKAKNLKKTAKILIEKSKDFERFAHQSKQIEKFNSHVPDNLESLLTLPGVGRKSANIILNSVFNKHAIGVDTHVHRISNRLGLVKTKKPHDTEKELMKKIPKQHLRNLNKIFVAYGQTVCVPISPFCSTCRLRGKYCPQIGVKRYR